MNTVLNIIILSISVVIYFFVNSQGLIDGPRPGFGNFILSIIYIIFIFLYGFLMGKIKEKSYIITSSIFWILGTISIYFMSPPLFIIGFAFFTPLNGLNYFEMPFMWFGPFVYTILPLIITLIGYYLGYKFSQITKEAIKPRQ